MAIAGATLNMTSCMNRNPFFSEYNTPHETAPFICTTMQGDKTLRIKMEDLASLLDDTRLNVSNVLNKWREEGLIEMRRKEYIFHNIERLETL